MTTPAPEFSRPVRVDTLAAGARSTSIGADEAERAALAKRFGILSIERLSAEAAMTRHGEDVTAVGTLSAAVTQSCVVTEVSVPSTVDEPFKIIFRPAPTDGTPDEEIELSEAECDVVFYSGSAIDLGEAVAETLLLSLDPWPRAPGAETVLKQAGVKNEEEAGAFGALAGLRDKLSGKS